MPSKPARFWLVKSEPSSWSWAQQVAKGDKGTPWTGVRNHTAKQNLMAMRRDDRAFFYHSNEGKEIVGIVEIAREAYPDPTAKTGEPWVVVDLRAVKALPKPVTLAAIKADKRLKNMALVKYGRLSVQPVTKEEWEIVEGMGWVGSKFFLSPDGGEEFFTVGPSPTTSLLNHHPPHRQARC
jgi:predicted RNA-binding protein with PUA-like domain